MTKSRNRDAPLYRVCAWCQRVHLGRWLALEQALRAAGVAHRSELGRPTHGICHDCFCAVTA